MEPMWNVDGKKGGGMRETEFVPTYGQTQQQEDDDVPMKVYTNVESPEKKDKMKTIKEAAEEEEKGAR